MKKRNWLKLTLVSALLMILVSASWAIGKTGETGPDKFKVISWVDQSNETVKQGVYKNSISGTDYAADELIVKFKRGVDEEQELSVHEQVYAKVMKKNKKLGLTKVKLSKNADIKKVMNKYKNDSRVQSVDLNYIRRAFFTPNDTYFSNQWGLQKIRATEAWNVTQGSTAVKVAILDTGVALTHPDLINNLVSGYNAVNNGATPQDDQGHGTHVAGIVAATLNNNMGVAGLGGAVKIMPVKVMFREADTGDGIGYDYDIIEGIQWAADNGAKVINMSLGGTGFSQAYQNAIDYAFAKGVVIVAAAGNDGNSTINYPAGYNHVIGVGSTDKNNLRSGFSNVNSTVDLTAPGGDLSAEPTNWILSTYYDWTTGQSGYAWSAGTSMATPYVAGLAGLLMSNFPSYTSDQIEQAMISSAVDLGSPGRDNEYGYGRIDAYTALTASTGGFSGSGDIYIDPINGNDSNDGLTSETAKKTLAAGWALVPGVFDRNYTIYLAAGRFTEQFEPNGKNPSGPFSITVEGSTNTPVTNTNSNIYSATTIGNTGMNWTPNSFKGNIVEIVSGKGSGQAGIIKSNTATTLTVAGKWTTVPDSSSVFVVKSIATVIDAENLREYSILITNQSNLTLKYVKGINATISGIRSDSPFVITTQKSEFTGKYISYMASKATMSTVYISGGGNTGTTSGGVRAINGGYLNIDSRCFIDGVKGSGLLITAANDAINVRETTISNALKYGVYVIAGGITHAAGPSVYIENCNGGGIGARAEARGLLKGFSSAVYTGQSTKYSADTATYSVID